METYAIARYDLRLSESEFWRMTPRAFMALVDRFNAARRHDLYCAALTASATYNVYRKEGSPVITPEQLIGEDPQKPERRMTIDEMKVLFQQAAAGLGGVATITP